MSNLQDFSLQEEDNERDVVKLEGMTREELLDLHSRIEQQIGGLELTQINLVKELLLQLHRGKALQEKASSANDAPLNQRAQVQNSLGNAIKDLAKIQSELYSSERIKRIQSAVIKVVKTLPKPQQDHFFELLEYELTLAAQETEPREASEVR